MDIVLELLEVFINSILYAREIYPASIFHKKKSYNTIIFASIFPPLNEYIKNVLKTARTLIRTSKLHRVEMLVFKNDMNFESFIFEISNDLECYTNDKYLIEFEEDIRKSLLNLDEKVKTLPKLPKDVEFKIYFHTTESSFVKLVNNSIDEVFPWVQDKQNSKMFKKTKMSSILPITGLKSVGFQIYAEKHN